MFKNHIFAIVLSSVETKESLNKHMLRRLYVVLLLMLGVTAMHATHNRAGEISIRQIGPLSIEITITTYTKTSSTAADRDSLPVDWGDGTVHYIRRSNGNGLPLPNDVKLNYYRGTHVYPGRGTYTISMTDPNRNGGIINVNPPRSDNIPFHIETTYTFLNAQFFGDNNTPVLLQPPIDKGCVGQRFKHNPNADDPDKDSLSYHLVVPLQGVGSTVPNYSYPDQIGAGPQNNISINESNGDFIWDAPQVPGEYNIAIEIWEHRNGQVIGKMIRDMQILIETCDNRPPDITSIDQVCVVAGDLLSFEVTATDPDIPQQKIELTALGGPLSQAINPAVFNAPPGFATQPVKGVFSWTPDCNQIVNQPYSVVFKATDNYNPGLSDLKTVRIKVIGPPPLNLQATAINQSIRLTWDKPYFCEDAQNDYFRGFAIYRKVGSSPIAVDTCFPGLEGKGYTRIAGNIKSFENSSYFYIDSSLERGRTYCYRIVAEFALKSASGNPYNLVQSLHSNEACGQLSRDVPILTQVSVEETSASTGKMRISWVKPKLPDLDTIKYPGPYLFRLQKSTGFATTGFVDIPGADFAFPTFQSIRDTFYLDNTGLNTIANPYSYRVAFYVNGETQTPANYSNTAASVFLKIASSDKKNTLTWEEMVPWFNTRYGIFRYNETTSQFDSIGFATTQEYVDKKLLNGKEYCYLVKAFGTYGLADIPEPLINWSQEVCGIPVDTVGPCPPQLKITNPCDENITGVPPDQLFNKLEWTNPALTCEGSEDVDGYRVYYAPTQNDPFVLVFEIDNAGVVTFQHQSTYGLAGCYAVTSIDSVGNESAKSNIVCVDNCPDFSLPNTFTPNGDNQNDLFKPYNYRFIDKIDFKVYNRWGGLVFETHDPLINWNGTNLKGKDLPDGTYYYTCIIYEKRVDGIKANSNILSGYIELLR